MKRLMSVAILAAVLCMASCGGSPGGPSNVVNPPPPPTVVLAPAPAGVSATVWQVAFYEDNKLHYPKGAVHIILPPELKETTRNFVVSMVSEVALSLGGKTPMDTVNSASGATFVVSVVNGPACGVIPSGGCADFKFDGVTGEVLGGTIQFTSEAIMMVKEVVKHELYRTLGISRNNPLPGIMSRTPAMKDPSPEELVMFLGRYNYPLLAVFTP